MAVTRYSLVAHDWLNLEYIINDLTRRVVAQDVSPTSIPTFEDVIITGLSGSIISSTSVETSIEELDSAINVFGDGSQYLLLDGTRAMTGDLDLDGYNIDSVGTLYTDNIVLPDDGTIGVTDGEPSILFDNSDGRVEITGVLTVDSYMSVADAAAQLNILCHLYKAWEMTAVGDNTNRTGVASNIQAGKTGAADFTSYIAGYTTQVQLNNPNTQNWTNQFGLRGVDVEVNTEGSTSGTVTGMVGILLDASVQDAASVTNYYGIYHDSIYVAGSKLTNAYGIYLEDFDGGTGLNYAIYTNAGLVYFGDDTDVDGDFTAGTIQADNGFTGSFNNADGNTVTVVGGIITDVS
jgi:hypothetical protein